MNTPGLQVNTPNLGSYGFFAAVTKSDATVLDNVEGLYIGGAGDVAVADQNGDVVTFSAVPVGTILPIAVTKVMSTNTSATLILALKR